MKTKKLEKRFIRRQNTVDAYGMTCSCTCNAAYCAATWQTEDDWEAKQNFSDNHKITI